MCGACSCPTLFTLTLFWLQCVEEKRREGSPTLTSLKCLTLILTILVDFPSRSPLSTRFTDSRVKKKKNGWRWRWRRGRGNQRKSREEDKGVRNERIVGRLKGGG